MNVAVLWSKLWREAAAESSVKIAAILVVYVIIRFVVFKLIGRLLALPLARVSEGIPPARQARVRTLRAVLRSTVGVVLGFVVAVMVLEASGIPIVPLITTAGIAGLAIGFGAQKLVRDVIAGFFILMEDQYGVGDYVTIGAVTGIVEELGMRTTRLRDKAGKVYIISNGDIAQVCNASRGDLILTVDIALPASIDLEKAKRVLDEVGRALAKDDPSRVKRPFVSNGLIQLNGATATVRLVGSVAAEDEEAVRIVLNGRIRQAFIENDLQLA